MARPVEKGGEGGSMSNRMNDTGVCRCVIGPVDYHLHKKVMSILNLLSQDAKITYDGIRYKTQRSLEVQMSVWSKGNRLYTVSAHIHKGNLPETVE